MFESIIKQDESVPHAGGKCQLWMLMLSLLWEMVYSCAAHNETSLPEKAEIWPDEQNTAFTEAVLGHYTVSLCPLKLWKTVLNYSGSRFLALKSCHIDCFPPVEEQNTKFYYVFFFFKSTEDKWKELFRLFLWSIRILKYWALYAECYKFVVLMTHITILKASYYSF